MSDSLTVPARFNGPQLSGNGGYASGAVAGLLGGTVEVSLRSPIPLDTPLEVIEEGEGAVRVVDGETLVAEARTVAELDLAPPAPVSVEEATRAATRYRGLSHGEFSRCFVCGRDREDCLEIFAGAVEGRDVVATPWTPPDWTVDDAGRVRPELVWSVLDCPTYFALYHRDEQLPMSFLARFTVRLDAPVAAGEEHVVMAWPIGVDGRKHEAGSAVLSAAGDVLAVAHALLIEPRQQPGGD